MNNGAYLTHLLSLYDVDCVFGIPGVHTLELYRALGDSSIRHITPRHEQGAGFIADGYARVSGKPGVCFIISGPGMTNILTAMGQAYSESIPMLVISTVNSHGRMGSGDGWLHELPNQQAVVEGVCAFSHTVHCAKEIPQVLARAYAVFDSCRPRPVHIEIPINVLNEASLSANWETSVTRLHPPLGNLAQVSASADLINQANAPLILAGGGAKHCSDSLASLATIIDAPVIMTVNARGVLPTEHELAVSASASLPAVRALVEAADVVIAVGTELGATDYDFNEDGEFRIPGKLIRIDLDAQQLMRTCIPDIGIVGDADQTISSLLPSLTKLTHEESGTTRVKHCVENLNTIKNARDHRYLGLLDLVNEVFDYPVIVGDSTQIVYTSNSFYGTTKPAQYFNSAMGFGTLGYALPAAIGAAIATNHSTVVAISGDGGLQFCLSELATAIDANAQLILLVHENGGYKEIKKFMASSGIEPVGVDLMTPDLRKIAVAFGWYVFEADAFDTLRDVLSDVHKQSAHCLVLLPDTIFEA